MRVWLRTLCESIFACLQNNKKITKQNSGSSEAALGKMIHPKSMSTSNQLIRQNMHSIDFGIEFGFFFD